MSRVLPVDTAGRESLPLGPRHPWQASQVRLGTRRPPSTLPYAVVMATGIASELAARAGLGSLRAPLLWWAIAQAIGIALVGLYRRHHARSTERQPSPAPAERFGAFTVPLGFAVVGTGLAGLDGKAAHAGAAGVVALAWLATAYLIARVVAPLAAHPPHISAVGGTWFLAPAAVLADAIATGAALPHMPAGAEPALRSLVLAACLLGTAGYLATVALAMARFHQVGLGGTARVPWWIATGCGGLAAASIGRAGGVISTARGVPVAAGFDIAATAVWALGTVLLIPILAGSVRYVIRMRHLEGLVPWPPTFSTGVYALGTGVVGGLLHVDPLTTLSDLAGLATVVLWGATTALRVLSLTNWLPRDKRAGG